MPQPPPAKNIGPLLENANRASNFASWIQETLRLGNPMPIYLWQHPMLALLCEVEGGLFAFAVPQTFLLSTLASLGTITSKQLFATLPASLCFITSTADWKSPLHLHNEGKRKHTKVRNQRQFKRTVLSLRSARLIVILWRLFICHSHSNRGLNWRRSHSDMQLWKGFVRCHRTGTMQNMRWQFASAHPYIVAFAFVKT